MCSQWSRIAMFYNTSIRIVFDTSFYNCEQNRRILVGGDGTDARGQV